MQHEPTREAFVKFGIMLDTQFDRADDIGRRLDELVEMTETARDAGYESLFAVHHYLAELVTLQPLDVLARLIPHSGAMTLGTGVYLATVEHPIRLAENVATLDQLAGGRTVLGLGAGYRPEEFASFGVERASRWPRLAETVELVRELWSGDLVHHHGAHFAVDGQRASVVPAQDRIPIWVGANGPTTVLRAAAIGDSWLVPPNVKTRWAIGNLDAFIAEQARLGKPTADVRPIMRELYVAGSDAEAAHVSVESIRREYEAVAGHDLGHFVTMFDDLRAKAFMIGSPDTVRAQIGELADAGFNHFIFRMRWAGLPMTATLRSMRLLAEEVLPNFRDR